MKKKIWIPIVIVLIAVLFIPIPSGVYKDGGTREYTALTYKIVKWNRLTGDSTYDKLCVYLFPNNFRSIGSLWTREKDKVEHSFKVSPEPDTLIRVFMAWKKADSYIPLPEQDLSAVQRSGFTVVEWGGTEIQ